MGTNPDSGIIAINPATNPVDPLTRLGFPVIMISRVNQENIAAAAEICVVMRACAASPLAAKAEPALNPNHPN